MMRLNKKTKTFWAPLSYRSRARNHFWTRDSFPDYWCKSACGLRRQDHRILGRWTYPWKNRCIHCDRRYNESTKPNTG